MNQKREDRMGIHGARRQAPAGSAFYLLSVILLFSFALCGAGSAEVLDRVAATVNGLVITESELRETLELYQHQAGSAPQPSANEWENKAALQRRALEEIVDRKLMEEYAQKNGIAASEEEIEQAVKDVLGRANLTREQLMEALQKDGIPYQEYRDQIRDQIVKAKMIHREVRSQIVLKDEEIEGYYFEHPDEFRSEEGFVLRHVFLALPKDPQPAVVDAVMKEAQRIRQEILAGASFAEAAAKYSQDPSATKGGWLGFFRKDALSGGLEGAIAQLKEGEVSEPVLTQPGIHIVKLEEKTTGDIRPLEKVREAIREKLYEEAAERQFEQWRKDLRKNAYIEIFL